MYIHFLSFFLFIRGSVLNAPLLFLWASVVGGGKIPSPPGLASTYRKLLPQKAKQLIVRAQFRRYFLSLTNDNLSKFLLYRSRNTVSVSLVTFQFIIERNIFYYCWILHYHKEYIMYCLIRLFLLKWIIMYF